MSDVVDTSDDQEVPRRELDAEPATAPQRGPRWLPGTLVVVAAVLAVFSTMTTWVRTQALDTDQWVQVSGDLLAEDEVRDALAAYLADELFANVDIAGVLEDQLPDDVAGLAAPLTGALRGPLTDGIERLISSPRFRTAWVDANRAAHEVLVFALRGESRPNLSTDDGTVVLDLGNALTSAAEQLGVPQSALDRIPADAGQITIFTSDELARAQDAVTVLDVASWFLFVLVVVLYVLAVYLAVGRRREMLRGVGVSLVVAGFVVLALRAVGIRTGVDAFVDDPTKEGLARLVAGVTTELLQQLAWAGVVYGVLIILFSELLSDHRWSVALRRRVAGVADSTAMVAAIAVGAVVVLVWWSPARAFDRWATALTLLGLVVGAVIAVVSTGRRELRADQATASPTRGP